MRFTAIAAIVCVAAAASAALLTVRGFAGEDEADRRAAEAALDALTEAYATAYAAGDADALAKCFAEEAEYVDEHRNAALGRATIRQLASRFFEEFPGARLEAGPETRRIVSDSAAVETGIATVLTADGRLLSSTRYDAVYAREAGRWVIGSLRESLPLPGDISPRQRLESLTWLVGDWVDETDRALVQSSCEWSDDGPYLIQTFDVRDRRGRTTRSTQRIGWDPLVGTVRSWIWDSDGGYGEALWTPTADGWLLNARGVSATGVVATGIYRIRRQGSDAYRLETSEQIVGNTLVETAAHVIVRQPPEPR